MNKDRLPVGILIMSLHVVSRLYNVNVAIWTARRMEYDWST